MTVTFGEEFLAESITLLGALDVAAIEARLGALAFERGRPDEAEERLLRVRSIVEDAFGPDRPEAADARAMAAVSMSASRGLER